MKTCTQANQILAALKAGDKITPIDALRRFHCFRLGARVFDLREQGHKIQSKLVLRGGARVAQYTLA